MRNFCKKLILQSHSGLLEVCTSICTEFGTEAQVVHTEDGFGTILHLTSRILCSRLLYAELQDFDEAGQGLCSSGNMNLHIDL